MGIEQAVKNNSPGDCCLGAATSVSEAIGTGSAETNSHHPLQKKDLVERQGLFSMISVPVGTGDISLI